MTQIDIVADHPDFVVVNKPSGVAMHDSEAGIIPLLRKQLKVSELFLCHRLDTGTSGCLLVARNPAAAARMCDLFAQRQMQKYYLALLDNKPKKKQGTVSGDMKNRRNGQRILLKTQQNPAITQFFTQSLVPGIRLTIVKPHSGKTHQIRVAMKSLGAPILGDSLYSGSESDRLYLHAWGLCFDYQGQSIRCFCRPMQGEHFLSSQMTGWLEAPADPGSLPWPKIAPFTATEQAADGERSR